ncbi:MAG: S-ribosylhomocysteine lyase [Oscillospiraceae bacterium]|jgi:S-ribosylhomocysteine lyase|nr:S-ribosylhomocysteine lyase [Oscillospiraceae bacterium]
MERITSFSTDHTKFGVGMYISRIDDDIITYDVRMKKPNGGDYLSGTSAHTIEHLFATFARNSDIKADVIYVGPMGCLTGFYVLLRSKEKEAAIKLVKDALEFIKDFQGELPGSKFEECGNFAFHDLEKAKKDVSELSEILKNYSPEQLIYPV